MEGYKKSTREYRCKSKCDNLVFEYTHPFWNKNNCDTSENEGYYHVGNTCNAVRFLFSKRLNLWNAEAPI